MDHLKEDILNCLKNLKGSGKFISVHTTEFIFPGLEVDGVGEIAYPVNVMQAESLIKVAQKAPFGKGSKTILDNSVRSAWEIDAEKIAFNGDRWTAFLDRILSNVKEDLGLEGYTISAKLYKMLVYEKGDFFLPHKDTEKEKGMFASLIIGLPSKYTGGELLVRFEGVEEVANFAQSSSDYMINYAAFYADCDHEVKPLASGYRICLAYNLIQQKADKKIKMTSLDTHAEKLAEILTKQQQGGNTKPHIVLLGHQYTPENFSIDGLKLNDRPKAEVLLRAAEKAGCYAKMCLVTSYLSGMPDEGGYYDDDDYEDAEMVEVFDESLNIEQWLENDIPALNNVSFEEEDLISSSPLNDGEPIIKEATGYMGNYGPDLMHWYHYGAVMIWSPETNAQLLLQQNTVTKLEWIDYFSKNLRQASSSEVSAVELILTTGLNNDQSDKAIHYNAIAEWVIKRKDTNLFLRLDGQLCQLYFVRIDAAHWLKLIGFFPSEIIEKIFARVTEDITLPVVERLLSILRVLLPSKRFHSLIVSQMGELPRYFLSVLSPRSKKQFPAVKAILRDLFYIEKQIPQDETWIEAMTETFSGHPNRNFVHEVLVPQLLSISDGTPLVHKLLLTSRHYLQERVNNQPLPPADWSRQLPSTTKYKNQWQLLKEFMESPDEQVFDYRKNQSEREEMERAIRSVEVDLETETIKKGSPHTLRLVKTQAAYYKERLNWEEDKKMLNELCHRIKG